MPFLFAKDDVPAKPDAFDPIQYLGDVRNFVTRRVGDAVLLGEVNLAYKDQKAFFGGPDGDGLNMQFDFIGMQNIYLAMARGDARPIAKALRQRPKLDITSQWANFVRNHDELTLDKLSDGERQEVFDAFGPDPDMQLYGRGLRRRLPSMLGGDERRMKMAYSLAFSLPGTPVLFYGEEIGMAENLDIPGRLAVRSPMQWTGGHNGGFSRATKRRLTRPLPEGLYGPERVNAADQRRDHGSFWWFMRNLIYTYRPTAGDRLVDRRDPQTAQPRGAGPRVPGGIRLGDGRAAQLRAGQLHRRDRTRGPAAGLHARRPARRPHGIPLDAHGRVEIDLEPYGYRWLRCRDRRTSRSSDPINSGAHASLAQW